MTLVTGAQEQMEACGKAGLCKYISQQCCSVVRNVISITDRWEYVSGEGDRAELLPRKKEQESEFLERSTKRPLLNAVIAQFSFQKGAPLNPAQQLDKTEYGCQWCQQAIKLLEKLNAKLELARRERGGDSCITVQMTGDHSKQDSDLAAASVGGCSAEIRSLERPALSPEKNRFVSHAPGLSSDDNIQALKRSAG
ncbi:hypothetical protein Q9233_016059 [Columba guinea]|nr:hypothetical protein Q9233_016059 [Columba guinea]